MSSSIAGLSLVNENGGLRVFFLRNSFVTNTTLTHTIWPRGSGASAGNDHIVCYGNALLYLPVRIEVTWHDSSGGQLEDCQTRCSSCGPRCVNNNGVGVDLLLIGNARSDIHMYTGIAQFENQDLECRVFDGLSAFIGVYLVNGGECGT